MTLTVGYPRVYKENGRIRLLAKARGRAEPVTNFFRNVYFTSLVRLVFIFRNFNQLYIVLLVKRIKIWRF